jgi:hypothetical protein
MAFPLDYGSISFMMHRTDADAEFIRCRQTADKNLIVQHVLNVWKLDDPGVLMRVIGTPPDEDSASSEDQAEFMGAVEGVLRAGTITHAWLFCTGLSFGMGSALGTTLGRNRHMCDCPLIGFAQWSSVQKPEQMEISRATGKLAERNENNRVFARDMVREYKDVAPDEDLTTISLQANHSHFVLVNPMTDEELKAGLKEIDLGLDPSKPTNKLLEGRKKSFLYAHAFEEAAAATRPEGVPRVLAVLCGDETTLAEVVAFCREGTGIVVSSVITGGLAEALYSFAYNDGVVPHGWEQFSEQFDELKELNRARKETLGVKSSRLSTQSSMAGVSANSNGLLNFPFFAFATKRGKEETAQCILDSIMKQIASASRKVEACVLWNDADRLKHAFTTMVPAWHEDRTDVLCKATQLALTLEHAECIKVLVDLAAPVKNLDLLGLYDKLYDQAAPPRYPLFLGCPKPTASRGITPSPRRPRRCPRSCRPRARSNSSRPSPACCPNQRSCQVRPASPRSRRRP